MKIGRMLQLILGDRWALSSEECVLPSPLQRTCVSSGWWSVSRIIFMFFWHMCQKHQDLAVMLDGSGVSFFCHGFYQSRKWSSMWWHKYSFVIWGFHRIVGRLQSFHDISWNVLSTGMSHFMWYIFGQFHF
jgi:hypothetical protein